MDCPLDLGGRKKPTTVGVQLLEHGIALLLQFLIGDLGALAAHVVLHLLLVDCLLGADRVAQGARKAAEYLGVEVYELFPADPAVLAGVHRLNELLDFGFVDGLGEPVLLGQDLHSPAYLFCFDHVISTTVNAVEHIV